MQILGGFYCVVLSKFPIYQITGIVVEFEKDIKTSKHVTESKTLSVPEK